MAVIDERYDSRRRMPTFGGYLGAFLTAREAANAEVAPDLKRLMDAEADARGKIADLRERQAMLRGKKEELSVRSSDKAAELKTKIAVANIAAQARVTSADRAFRLGMQALYSDRAAKVAAKMLVPAEAASAIESATTSTAESVDTISARRSAMEMAKADEGSQEADVVDFAIWQGLRKRDAAKGTNDAKAYGDQYLGGNPEEYMARAYSVKSPEEVADMARKVSKEIGGAGVSPAVVDGWIKAEMLPSVESETVTRERSSGPTPDDLATAIAELTDYADGLAAQRQAAGAGRGPKGHSFLLNPNSYTDEKGWQALGGFATGDPLGNELMITEVERAGGFKPGYDRIGEMGGMDDGRSREYSADLLDTGLEIGEWLAGEIEARGKPIVVADGDWAYTVKSDGSVTITAGPKGSKAVGKTYTAKDKDDPIYRKIVEKIADSPEVKARRDLVSVLSAQPESVKSLFGESLALADQGDTDGAVKAAKAVSADDVRWAYADALEADPGKAAEGIAMLPEHLHGSVGASVLSALEQPDTDAAAGMLSGIGKAVKAGQGSSWEDRGEVAARKRGLEAQETEGTRAMHQAAKDQRDGSALYRQGQDEAAAILDKYASGKMEGDYAKGKNLGEYSESNLAMPLTDKQTRAILTAKMSEYDPKKGDKERGAHDALVTALYGDGSAPTRGEAFTTGVKSGEGPHDVTVATAPHPEFEGGGTPRTADADRVGGTARYVTVEERERRARLRGQAPPEREPDTEAVAPPPEPIMNAAPVKPAPVTKAAPNADDLDIDDSDLDAWLAEQTKGTK